MWACQECCGVRPSGMRGPETRTKSLTPQSARPTCSGPSGEEKGCARAPILLACFVEREESLRTRDAAGRFVSLLVLLLYSCPWAESSPLWAEGGGRAGEGVASYPDPESFVFKNTARENDSSAGKEHWVIRCPPKMTAVSSNTGKRWGRGKETGGRLGKEHEPPSSETASFDSLANFVCGIFVCFVFPTGSCQPAPSVEENRQAQHD